MKNFQELLNRKLNVEFASETINVCSIVSLIRTAQQLPGRGAIYFCVLKWEKSILDLPDEWEIDEVSLTELLERGATTTGKGKILNFSLQNNST